MRKALVIGYKKHIRKNTDATAVSDLLLQDLMENALKRAHCVPELMYEKLSKFSNFQSQEQREAEGGSGPDTLMQRNINNKDWNCHDAECDIPVTLKGIWGYGCWCNFGNKLLKGRGKPVNKHDKVCMDMQQCLRCAEMDAAEDNYLCNVKNAQYNSLLEQSLPGQNENIHSINSGCSIINENNLCGAHVCTCEMQMINDILALVWDGYTHDPTPRHPDNPLGGTFDYESECEMTTAVTGEKECCGKYPFRFPYNSAVRECCEGDGVYETYSMLDQICCADGVKMASAGGC